MTRFREAYLENDRCLVFCARAPCAPTTSSSGTRCARPVEGWRHEKKTACAFVRLLCLLGCAQAAFSASYYVDSAAGNDAWSGKQSGPVGAPAVDGPWRSLARVAKAGLQPGDLVHLRCGRTRNETLQLPAAGTSTARITVRSYPYPCDADRPSISGFTPIAPAFGPVMHPTCTSSRRRTTSCAIRTSPPVSPNGGYGRRTATPRWRSARTGRPDRRPASA